MTELEARVLLNMVPGIGPARAGRLLSYFGEAVKIFNASPEEIRVCSDVVPELAAEILAAPAKFDAAAEIDRAGKYGARILTPADRDYPARLREIFDPPQVIYVYGALEERDADAVAVVGTRRPTDYGRLVCGHITADLAVMGITIISGLARGIDTEAHRAALAAGGRTVAVLGGGLGTHYPLENMKLEEKIAGAGAVVSEFPMGFPTGKGTFPRRNRIIAGLSLGTVVVEAPEKSGALITAMFALEQGKEVFAVPGSVMSRCSRGPHWLIKQGAKLAANAADIVEEIGRLRELAVRNLPEKSSRELLLSEEEKKVLDVIENSSGGIDIDAIKHSTGSPFGELSQALISLEIKGAVKAMPGKVYVKL